MLTITLTKDRLNTLAELATLGNYVISSCNNDEQTLKKYSHVCNMLYLQIYLNSNNISSPDDMEENELADIGERIGGEMGKFLQAFEHDVISEYIFKEQ